MKKLLRYMSIFLIALITSFTGYTAASAPPRACIDTPVNASYITDSVTIKGWSIIAELVAKAGDKNALVHGRKLTKTKDGKTVAYAKALAELAPGADLSKWESVRKGGWRLS